MAGVRKNRVEAACPVVMEQNVALCDATQGWRIEPCVANLVIDADLVGAR